MKLCMKSVKFQRGIVLFGNLSILSKHREMENISRGPTPSGILSLSAPRRRCRTSQLQGYRVQEYRLPSLPSFKCNVLRESLSVDSQNIPCATLQRKGGKGVVGNLCISLSKHKNPCEVISCETLYGVFLLILVCAFLHLPFADFCREIAKSCVDNYLQHVHVSHITVSTILCILKK
jgi:hypothetical protein